MRFRLLMSDVSAVLLGVLGFYAILAATLLGAYHSGGLMVLLVLLFGMSMCFLLPGLHNRMVRLTYERFARIPFVVLAGLWLQMTMGLFVKLEGFWIALPGWTFVTQNWVWIYLGAAALLVFSYVFPAAAYDVIRAEARESALDDDVSTDTADTPQ